MSKCKICGAPFNISMPLGGIFASPTCRCGAIRKRIRKEGCPECKATGKDIMLDIDKISYFGYCKKCDAHWSVVE